MLCGCGVHATQYLDAIRRGVRLILSRQLATGDWQQERISGVFNGNAAIHYPAYKNNMTLWALGRYRGLLRSDPAIPRVAMDLGIDRRDA